MGIQKAGFEANKINFNTRNHFILYNGIEEKFFIGRDKDKRSTFTKINNLSKDALIFISIANFVPFKDYFTSLNGLAKLKNDGIKFHYNIIGKGEMEGDIINNINELGLEKNITIYNNNPNIPELLSVADIMIHSSLGEGCSNAILEAKAAGLRVVASNTGGTKEILGDEDFLFEYKNVTDFVSKLKNAIKSSTEKTLESQAIQNKTKERFSVKKMQQNYTQIINSILND